ncbi:unnamed protein product [Lampetra fluviatilis]
MPKLTLVPLSTNNPRDDLTVGAPLVFCAADQVLQVTRGLQDVRVPSSGTAVFELELSGPAARPPRWALNGTRLRDGSGGAHMEARGTVYRLSLFEPRASMSGLVEFSAGEAKSSAQLTVV